jgi:hypothetical protein
VHPSYRTDPLIRTGCPAATTVGLTEIVAFGTAFADPFEPAFADVAKLSSSANTARPSTPSLFIEILLFWGLPIRTPSPARCTSRSSGCVS